jgi:hypothetical protein
MLEFCSVLTADNGSHSREQVCEESDECKSAHHIEPAPGVCKCSGEWDDLVEVVDKVRIPHETKPGKYVLGWRWDCEESTQVRHKRCWHCAPILRLHNAPMILIRDTH